MRVNFLTLFPEFFEGALNFSLIKKAGEKGILDFNVVDLREFATDKHRTADDPPYGGGPGMVMKAELVLEALKKLGQGKRSEKENGYCRVLVTPSGKTFSQERARELKEYDELTIICGHYEGIDERILPYVDAQISVGDYVLTGGELPALVIVDAVAREIPGVIKERSSVVGDSFQYLLLDFPCYTRPESWEGQAVPAVLISGNHKFIEQWRRKEQLKRTLGNRPDLLAKAAFIEPGFNAADRKLMGEIVLGA